MVKDPSFDVCYKFFDKDCVIYNKASAETFLLSKYVAGLLKSYNESNISVEQFESALVEQEQNAQQVLDKLFKSKLMKT